MAALLYHHSETSIARRSAPKGSAIVPFAGDLRSRDGRSGGLLPFRHGPDPAITEGRDRGWWGIAASSGMRGAASIGGPMGPTSWRKPRHWMSCSFQSARRAAIHVRGTATEGWVDTEDGMVVSADVMLRGEHES